LLKRYAEKVYMLFDGDEAGRKATLRSMELFLEEGFPARVIEVPSGDDPDTFINREGGAAFEPLLEAALPIFEFYYRGVLAGTDTSGVEGKVACVNEVAPRLAKIVDPLERELYEKEICRALKIDQGMLRKRAEGASVGAQQPPQQQSRYQQQQQQQPKPRPATRQNAAPEEVLLSLMVKFPEVVGKVRELGPDALFTGSHVAIAANILLQSVDGSVDLPAVLEQLESPEERTRLSSLFVQDEHLEDMDALKAFEQCRQALQRGALKGGGKTLARELAQLDPESPRYREILIELEALRNKKSKLS
jgi:DNA primase